MIQHIPENYRAYVYASIAIATIAAIPFMGGFQLKNKTRQEALRNLYKSINPFPITRSETLRALDRNSGDLNRPASMIDSKLPAGSNEVQAANFDAYKRDLLRNKLGAIKVSRPNPQISHYTTAIAIALTATFGASVIAAGDQRGARLAAAFDFTPPEVVVPPPKLLAIVKPPKGIKHMKSLYLSDLQDPEAVHKVHTKSTLEILSFDRQASITVGGKPLELEKTIPGDGNQITYKFKPITLNEEACKESCTIQVKGGQSWKIAINPDSAPTVRINTVEMAKTDGTANLRLRCRAHDDYGIKDGQLDIAIPGKSKEAQPPPQAQLPKMHIPGSDVCP